MDCICIKYHVFRNWMHKFLPFRWANRKTFVSCPFAEPQECINLWYEARRKKGAIITRINDRRVVFQIAVRHVKRVYNFLDLNFPFLKYLPPVDSRAYSIDQSTWKNNGRKLVRARAASVSLPILGTRLHEYPGEDAWTSKQGRANLQTRTYKLEKNDAQTSKLKVSSKCPWIFARGV